MAQLGCSCNKQLVSTSSRRGGGKIRAKVVLAAAATASVSAGSTLSSFSSKDHAANSKSKYSNSQIRSRTSLIGNFANKPTGIGEIESRLTLAEMAFRSSFAGHGHFSSKRTDKFANKPEVEFGTVQKLYPIADVNNELNGSFIVNQNLSSSGLADSVDEGIYFGNYTAISGRSILIADEDTYIQPSSILTAGEFNYQCEMTPPVITPLDSLLVIRASAPTDNFQSLGPPKYTLRDIRLSDPDGNIIIEYENLDIVGDNEFTTYFVQPKTNNAKDYKHTPYPILGEQSDYVLNINIDSSCYIDDPFSPEYNSGYQDTCDADRVPANNFFPTPSLKISAIEINNSGSLAGLLNRQHLPFSIKIDEYGDNISRRILPATIMDSEFVSTVWPTTNSIWESSETLDGLSGTNTNASGISVINQLLSSQLGAITLLDTGEVADSGKLNMMFSHTRPKSITQPYGGDFAFGRPSAGIGAAVVQDVPGVDDWFVVRDVKLKLKARKAPGSRDFVLDVVGYSDDHILNVTPKAAGFLQNIEGVGVAPVASGFQEVDDLAISAETISDKSEFFVRPFGNDGKDHYQLTTAPVVDSVDWKEYEVPLAIYEDNVQLGKSPDYRMASYFEKLILDIYPLPVGAQLADIRLEIEYGPSNALMMHSLGHETKLLSNGNVVFYPSAMKSVDDVINSNIDTQPLSLIEDIPHGYSSPETIKTNYSRRWRGINSDILIGAFDPLAFDASFTFSDAPHPFNLFHFDFTSIDGNKVKSSPFAGIESSIEATIGSPTADTFLDSRGYRFNDSKIFPSSPRSYRSIDWTDGSSPFNGKISDAFTNAMVISGATSLTGPTLTTLGEFALFVRFSPIATSLDATLTHIINNANSTNGMRISINNGVLRGSLRDSVGAIRHVSDTVPVTDYSFPLSVMLTYKDNELTLWTDNEIAGSEWLIKRRTIAVNGFSPPTQALRLNTEFVVTELGLSSPCNVVESDPDERLYETTVERFFDSYRMKFWQDGQTYTDDRYKLWDYVNDNIDDWYIGAFNHEQFAAAYDQYNKRGSKDYLTHNLISDGTPYSDITNITLPTNINTSGITYHSQIENDSLRFNIISMSEAKDRYWSALPRVSKSIPRGYKFEERGFVVESVVEHESDVQIPWPWDGYTGNPKFGPKVIVSLYSRNKDPKSYNADNWGLISRKSHYIHPVNDSLIKFITTFNYDDLIDTESEPWANFDQSKNTTELAHKYFSSDLDDMFVQYDIVYPADTPFRSQLKLHTVHVAAEQALLESDTRENDLNLAVSGELAARDVLNLDITGVIEEELDMHMYIDGVPMPSGLVDMPMYTQSAFFAEEHLPMYVQTVGFIGFGQFFGSSRFGAAAPPLLNMSVEGGLPRGEGSINMTTVVADIPANVQVLNMHTQTQATWQGVPSSFDLVTRGSNVVSPTSASSMNVTVTGSTDILPSGAVNLVIEATPPPTQQAGSVGLFSVTNLYFNPDNKYQDSIDWTGDNYGRGITFSDQQAGVAELALLDEIRGVQTICWGSCDEGGSCIQEPIITHGVEWYNGDCVDGGVIHALTTYTNPAVGAFNTTTPYYYNFYGIRKYTGLQPNSLYDITITGRTATDRITDVPPEATEWEYGRNDEVAYSGVKIVESGRQIDNKYGKAVEVNENLMFVGSPYEDITDSQGYTLEEAGTVHVYRRQPQPSGPDWSDQYHKAGWDLEEKLTLPDGFKRDGYVDVPKTFPGTALRGTERLWAVGQEGRRLGSSLASSVNAEGRELVAVGGPFTKFTRTFPDLSTDPINVAMFVVTNEFVPRIPIIVNKKTVWLDADTVRNAFYEKDVEFTYFADPSTKFNIRLVIVEPLLGEEATPPFPEPKPTFASKAEITRHINYDRLTQEFQDKDNVILQQLKDIYHEKFPLVADQIHSGIPPLLGLYVDDSASLRERAVQPATDRFINYWKSYTFTNGLRNFEDAPASGHVSYVAGKSENWVQQSIELLDDVLDTGKMIEDNYYQLFARGVGESFYQSDVNESNTQPISGGAVFLFEKFDNGWSPIQRIDSPTQDRGLSSDRFGHALDMGKEGTSLIIGSPYIDKAVQYFDINESATEDSYNTIGGWLAAKATTNAYIATLSVQYSEMASVSGQREAGIHIYNNITPSGRYQFRLDEGIDEFLPAFDFSHSDRMPQGQWQFVTNAFSSSPRLGYSVAVNEDATVIAAGSPTDSMNYQEQIPIWYRPGLPATPDMWFSSVNAGSVSVWNARAYYPHDKAVQYGRFGNLHEILNSGTDPVGTYDHMADIYSNIDVEFDKMDFDRVDIPEDAGLMFLINPASGALSEEILDNIEDWLALGDRHLVLVGNDPVWEASGVYQYSNTIINDLLRKIDSRMVLQPARNQYEACLSGVPFEDNSIVVPGYDSREMITTIDLLGRGTDIVGSGYADIRIFDEGIGDSWSCGNAGAAEFDDTGFGGQPLPLYWELNSVCNMYLDHLGDMRAQWMDACFDKNANPVVYRKTLAYAYGTDRAGCSDEEFAPPYRPGYEPRAIMAAAETPPPYVKTIPEIPERIDRQWQIVGQQVVDNVWRFAETAESGLTFMLTDSQQSGIDLVTTNLGANPSPSRWIDPDYYGGRDGFLQSRSTSEAVPKDVDVTFQYPYSVMSEEMYSEDNGSSVVLFSCVGTESKTVIDSNFGDINQNMYANLVGKNSNGQSKIAQLGGWTDRLGFKQGFADSALVDIFRRNGNTVTENVSMADLALDQNDYNVAWVANSSGIMSDQDVTLMKDWLNKGDKKLVVTFGSSPDDRDGQNGERSVDIANSVTNLCDQLDISIRPVFLPGKDRFAQTSLDLGIPPGATGNINAVRRTAMDSINISQETYVGKGFTDFNTEIEYFRINDGVTDVCAVLNTDKAIVHGYLNATVMDNEEQQFGLEELVSGTAKIEIPVIPESGYRVYVTTVAESKYEKQPWFITFGDVFGEVNREYLDFPVPALPEGAESIIEDTNYLTREKEEIDTVDFLTAPGMSSFVNSDTGTNDDPIGRPVTRKFDFLVPSGVTTATMYIQGQPYFSPAPERGPFLRKTPRFLAVSGAYCPMNLIDITEPVYELVETVIPAVPASSVIVRDELRQISTGSTKYCPEDNDSDPSNGISCSGYFADRAGMDPLIADGPVVVAQEVYYNRPFDAGKNRSRITVISDASLIEGKSILTSTSGINPQLSSFLHSLYPYSPEYERGGKQFVEYEKIMPVEKTSPQRLYANTGNSGIIMRFQGDSNRVMNSGTPLDNFSNNEDNINNTSRGNIYSTLSVEGGKSSTYLLPYDGPPRSTEVIDALRRSELARFDSMQYTYGGTARFSGVYDGVMYTDAGPAGGIPEIMRDTGYDYLDFEKFPSGYPGDLFGYSLSLFGKKLLVGSPFTAWSSENVAEWEDVANNTEYLSGSISGAIIGHNGGAGAAYLYELGADQYDTNPIGEDARWGMIRKFRPSGINTGSDLDDTAQSQAYKYLGLNNYTEEELKQLTTMSDMFGYDVDMDYDMMVISAPGHDFGNKITDTQAAFQRKSFDAEFDIQRITYTDLGASGVREETSEGSAVLNQGAVFSYQNNITNWGAKTTEWEQLQKVLPQGYNSNEAGVSENDFFGASISIHRGLRVDGDYTMAVGTPRQDYATSGNTPEMSNAGATYAYEVMLRKQPPAFAESGTWINASVYGEKPLIPEGSMSIGFNNGTVRNEVKQFKGRVLSDPRGQIFIEASGQDFAEKGYVEHRPVIEAVQGYLTQGEETVGLMRLSTTGRGPVEDGTMSLYVGSEGGTVYNNIGMYTGGILGYGSGTMPLMAYCQSGILHTSTVNMVASGAGLNTDILGLRTRGK